MKTRFFACLLFCSLVLGASRDVVACHHSITSITLSPTTACPGDEVQVTVNVELHGRYYDVRRWGSTSIDGVCYDNTDHSSNNGCLSFSETFTINADSVVGLDSVEVKTFAYNNCRHQKDKETVNLSVIQCCPTCEDGDDCTIERHGTFVTITCGDTVAYLYDGEDGEDGLDGESGPPGELGPQGIPGLSCTVEQVGLCANILCEDGTSAVVCNGEQGPQGEDGGSCTVVQDGDCAVITCEDESSSTICDGADGVNGTSCWVENRTRKSIIHCGESSATVWNGLSCWDLNSNRIKDFCSPALRRLFDGECPTEFIHEYECGVVDGLNSKASVAARVYVGHMCSVDVSCTEYLMINLDVSEEVAAQMCLFTEDVNFDEVIDVLDCRGDVGADGSIGPQGPGGMDGRDGVDGVDGQDGKDGVDGIDGIDGVDGVDGVDGTDGVDGDSCSVLDNGDATCSVVCADSEVLIYNCGVGAEPEEILVVTSTEVLEEDVPNSTPCGAFGGVTLVAMLLPLSLIRQRSRRHSK